MGRPAMEFSHPLARAAKIWPMEMEASDGPRQKTLVIVTTLELDPHNKRYKLNFVKRLSAAAREFLAESKDATSFLLINRLREWNAHRS
jgi:hypothetical protein